MTKKKSGGGLWETVRVVFYAVLIALVIRAVAFEPFNIPSGSMVPTLLVGDYLFVSKFSYGYSRYSLPFGLPLFKGRILERLPDRGDVAVFKLPRDTSQDYIKRVIGLPGDRIQVVDGVLHINGTAPERRRIEDYVPRSGAFREPLLQYIETLPNGVGHRILERSDNGGKDNTNVFLVPEDHLFMMGDNRDNSVDSRFPGQVGYVPIENLVGRAEIIFFSSNGSASLWEVWKWPWAIRYSRLFDLIK